MPYSSTITRQEAAGAAFKEVINMYEDENNLYHYSYRKGDGQEPNAPIDTKNYAEDPWERSQTPSPKKKGGMTAKVVALALVCALLGGFVGAGVNRAALTAKAGTTTVQVSDRQVGEVKTMKVDGKTEMTMAEVYAANVNSVVSINVSSTTNYFGQAVETAASGTGFFITQDGYILTNYHVVKGASTVKVTLYNGETYDASVIGGDEDYDIAVIKIDVTGASAVVLGDSGALNIGESVAAIGNPLGELTFSMTEGIVSCVNRAVNIDGTPFNMIQVDASINPGNSGGPLMNLYGEVVGIVSAKYSSYSDTTVEGLGFAIPIGDVQAIITDIMENGQITNKPSFGITAGTMTQQMAAQYQIDQTSGAFVYSVNKGGAGEKAGLKMGDVITKVDSADIASMEDLTAAKKGHKAGDTVTVTYYRDGQTQTTELTFDAKTDDTDSAQQEQQPQQDSSFDSLYDYFFGRR